ncbi:MAG: dihydropteroate synthase [Planctomycetota bacterium]
MRYFTPSHWQLPRGRLSLDEPIIMGILNTTPDSFSDGGLHLDPQDALETAMQMIRDGARVIDVGGESTRPGSQSVPPEEQIRRTIPVIKRLRQEDPEVLISIDTTNAAVADRAIKAGADIINETSAALDDPKMLKVASRTRAGLILMHRRGTPDQETYSTDVVSDLSSQQIISHVRGFLLERARAAIAAGIDRRSLVLDPGLGFGKTVEQNCTLIARTRTVCQGYPALSAASRKSFIGATTGRDRPADRDPGSVAVTLTHFNAGVRLFRVHNVRAHADALSIQRAIHGKKDQQISPRNNPSN